jgi:hypothetical protein
MIAKKYDVIIVGSSPLLMMYALQERRNGRSVLLINDEHELGGAWTVGSHLFNGKMLAHENACHLIEWYEGCYELLERLSGVKFVRLDPQPVKVFADGRVMTYTSINEMLSNYLWQWVSLLLGVLKLVKYGIRGRFNKINQAIDDIAICIEEIKIATRYRIIKIKEYNGIYGPEGGYAKFVPNIIYQLKENEIEILHKKVKNININEIIIDDESIAAREVVVGESSIINRASAFNSQLTTYYHILISTPSKNVHERNSYVHYPDHTTFHRITYVEDVVDQSGEEWAIFLIQLRRPFIDIIDFKTKFSKVQNSFKLVRNPNQIELLKIIQENYVSDRGSSCWKGYKENSPKLIRTIGDLSRNLVTMKHEFDKKISG